MAQRAGFIVKNAPDVGTDLDLAEPDAGDFNLLGNHRFGVISGCEVTVSGASWNVSVSPGIVVVDGQLASTGGMVTLPLSTQEARFDLIAVTSAGAVTSIQGTPSPNPVFPDLPIDRTVIASVYVRPGSTPPVQADVTDKRTMLPDRVVTAINGTGLVLSSNDPLDIHSEKFSIRHDGRQRWMNDTVLERASAHTLRVLDHLILNGNLQANGLNVTGNITATGTVTTADFSAGDGPPAVDRPGTPGDIYRDKTNGTVWVLQQGVGWVQFSAVPIPAGMVMMSMSPAQPPGWLLLNGQIVTNVQAGGLWDLFPAWRTDGTHLQVPNMLGRMPMGGTPGQTGGAATMLLTEAHMPAHKHLTSPLTAAGGPHTHPVSVQANGAHGHVTDPGQGAHGHQVLDTGHVHTGAEGSLNSSFIVTDWGGRNKIDGYFNDASHTFSVEARRNTERSGSNIDIAANSGAHSHVTDVVAAHSHFAEATSAGGSHQHTIEERTVGNGQSFSILPPYFSVVWLIKT